MDVSLCRASRRFLFTDSYTQEEITLVWSLDDAIVRSREFTAPGITVKKIQANNCSQGNNDISSMLEIR